jgi:hypothetical protein
VAYDYFEAAGESIKDFVLENIEPGTTTPYDLAKWLIDNMSELWKDALNCNDRGYIYINEAQAKEYVEQNKKLVENAYDFLGFDDFSEDIEKGNYKAMDAVTRFYVFVDSISIALELINKENPLFFKDENDEG